jgi:hypothetical protein
MICPHCATAVKYDWEATYPEAIDEKKNTGTEIAYATCPNCENIVVYLQAGSLSTKNFGGVYIEDIEWELLIYPKNLRIDNSDDIPKDYLEDYEESLKVLSGSPKASAALSRRLLQNILREEYTIKENSLSQEIDKFINRKGIPSHITDAVDAVRNIGNFAAHPIKDKNTGEIVPVEFGEAEWLIEVIEALFDFTFIQPIKLKRRREELNIKLKNMGKPEMKAKQE